MNLKFCGGGGGGGGRGTQDFLVCDFQESLSLR